MEDELLELIIEGLRADGATESEIEAYISEYGDSPSGEGEVPVQEEEEEDELLNAIIEGLRADGATESEIEAYISEYKGEATKPEEVKEDSQLEEEDTVSPSIGGEEVSSSEQPTPEVSEERLEQQITDLEGFTTFGEDASPSEKLFLEIQEGSKVTPEQETIIQNTVKAQIGGEFGLYDKVTDYLTESVRQYGQTTGLLPFDIGPHLNPYEAQRDKYKKKIAKQLGVDEKHIPEDAIRDLYFKDSEQKLRDRTIEINGAKIMEDLSARDKTAYEATVSGRLYDLNKLNQYRVTMGSIKAKQAGGLRDQILANKASVEESGIQLDLNNPEDVDFIAKDQELRNQYTQLGTEITKLQIDFSKTTDDLQSSEKEFDIAKRNYNEATTFFGEWTAANTETLIGLAYAMEGVSELGTHYIGTPTIQEVVDYVVEGAFGEEDFIKSVDEYAQKFAKDTRGSVRKPSSFGEIDGGFAFGHWAASQIASAIPQLTMMTAIKGKAALGAMSALSYGTKLKDLEEEEKLGLGKYSFEQKQGAAIAVGFAEYLGESVTLGIFSKSKRFYQASMSEGLRREFNKGFFREMAGAGGASAKAFFKEGASEGGTEVMSNIADILILGKKDKTVVDNFWEVFASGGFTGSTLYNAPTLAAYFSRAVTSKDTQQRIGENLVKYRQLSEDLLTADESTKGIIESQMVKLDNENNKIVNKVAISVDSLTLQERGAIAEMMSKEFLLRQQYTNIMQDKNISKETRDSIIESLDADYQKITAARYEAIDAAVLRETNKKRKRAGQPVIEPDLPTPPDVTTTDKVIPPVDTTEVPEGPLPEIPRTRPDRDSPNIDQEALNKELEDRRLAREAQEDERGKKRAEKANLRAEIRDEKTDQATRKKQQDKLAKIEADELAQVEKEIAIEEKEKEQDVKDEADYFKIEDDKTALQKDKEVEKEATTVLQKEKDALDKERDDVVKKELNEAGKAVTAQNSKIDKAENNIETSKELEAKAKKRVKEGKTPKIREKAKASVKEYADRVKKYEKEFADESAKAREVGAAYDKAHDKHEAAKIESALKGEEVATQRKRETLINVKIKNIEDKMTRYEEAPNRRKESLLKKAKKKLAGIFDKTKAATERRKQRLEDENKRQEDSDRTDKRPKADVVESFLRDGLEAIGGKVSANKLIDLANKSFDKRQDKDFSRDIDNYIDKTKKSDWYKKLDQEGKDEADIQFEIYKEDILAAKESDILREEQARTKTKDEDKIIPPTSKTLLGEPDNKITISEKTALRDQVKVRAKSVKDAFSVFKKAAKDKGAVIGEFTKQALKGSILTDSQRGSIIKEGIALVDPSAKEMDKFFEKVGRYLALSDHKINAIQFKADLKAAKDNVSKRFGNAAQNSRNVLNINFDYIPVVLIPHYKAAVKILADKKSTKKQLDFANDLGLRLEESLIQQRQDEIIAEREKTGKEITDEAKDKALQDQELVEFLHDKLNQQKGFSDFENTIIQNLKDIPVKWLLDNLGKGRLKDISIETFGNQLGIIHSGRIENRKVQEVITEFKAYTAVQAVLKGASDWLVPAMSTWRKIFRGTKKKKEYSGDKFAVALQGVILKFADTAIKGMKGTPLYDYVFGGFTRNHNSGEFKVNSIEKGLTAKIGVAKDSRLGKRWKRVFRTVGTGIGFIKGQYENDLQIITQLYMEQRQFECQWYTSR